MDRMTENMKIWLRALYLETAEEAWSAAKHEHLCALGSDTDEASVMHELNADEQRQFAELLEDMAAELLKE